MWQRGVGIGLMIGSLSPIAFDTSEAPVWVNAVIGWVAMTAFVGGVLLVVMSAKKQGKSDAEAKAAGAKAAGAVLGGLLLYIVLALLAVLLVVGFTWWVGTSLGGR